MRCRLRWWILAGGAIVVVGVVIVDAIFGLHAQALGILISLVGFFQTKSLKACVTYVMVYISVSVLCLPLTPFEIFTGFCFGVPFGIVLDITGRLSGAMLSFLIARTLSRQGVDCPYVTGAAVLRGIGKAVEEQGLRFLVLFNLAYVPVAVKNYGLGFVPEVALYKFVLSTFIVEVPMASIWATIGSAAAADLEAAGLSVSNSTAAKAVFHEGPARGGWQLKAGLLAVGVSSVLLVLHIVHKKVSAELHKVAIHKFEGGVEDGLPDESASSTAVELSDLRNR